MSPAPLLELDGLSVALGGAAVVDRVSFALEAGTTAALLGASGCGKTTLLRAIAGFEPVIAGSVRIGGTVASAPGTVLAPERRGVGLVFQDLALFPHLDVAGNVGFALARQPRSEREARVEEVLALLELLPCSRRYPHELSGGQQQRVAIARALAPRPALLLLDEPLSSLDDRLRRRLGRELRELFQRLGVAALLVTHDQGEAFAFGARVGVMRTGRIEQWDTAFELYHRPATRYVAEFVGEGRCISGRLLDGGMRVATALGEFPVATAAGGGGEVDVLIRPDDLRHEPAAPHRAVVRAAEFRGTETRYALQLASGEAVDAAFPSHLRLAPGAEIGVATDLAHVVVFARG